MTILVVEARSLVVWIGPAAGSKGALIRGLVKIAEQFTSNLRLPNRSHVLRDILVDSDAVVVGRIQI